MKYYLVNFILMEDKIITLNENIGISLHSFANIDEFKQSIALNMDVTGNEQVVIKSYKQISQEAFDCLNVKAYQ